MRKSSRRKGPGRPPKGRTEGRLVAVVDLDLVEEVRAVANGSMSAWVRDAIHEKLARETGRR